MAQVHGAHFCGSVQLPNDDDNEIPEDMLRGINIFLPGILLRIPDSEPGKRQTFCGWQIPVFAKTPWIMSDQSCQLAGLKSGDYPPGKMEDIALGSVQYDKYVIQSFQNFAKVKFEGGINQATRFQVCLPTPINAVTYHVKQEYRERAEQLYEEALFQALANMQASIPHAELAIQWDCPTDVLFLEGMKFPFHPHFEVSMDSIVSRLARLAAAINEEVQVGFHLCYGDFEHRHTLEPKDTGLMVKLTNALTAKVQRRINWIHMPVPMGRKDAAYFEPLGKLKLVPELELYLGVVHANDPDGTHERIARAQKTVPGLKFGISTECGLGRTLRKDMASIFEILNTSSAPVSWTRPVCCSK